MKKFLLSSSLLFCFLGLGLAQTSESPNIIYILADDMGIGDASCYNPDGKIKTIHLDKMAENGMKFTDAHTSSSVCTPTRYGILTGRYNWRSTLKNGVFSTIDQQRSIYCWKAFAKGRIPYRIYWQMAPGMGLGIQREV